MLMFPAYAAFVGTQAAGKSNFKFDKPRKATGNKNGDPAGCVPMTSLVSPDVILCREKGAKARNNTSTVMSPGNLESP